MNLLALAVCTISCHYALGQTASAPHAINCVGEADGLHEIGCWGYANCLNGQPDVHSCPVGMVLERDTMTCIKPGDGHTDCYLPTECVGKADGSYPDPGDHCLTYYRCMGEINLGRFYCPALTAFNVDLQICDYPRNMPPPCGTKGGVATKPTTPIPTTPIPTTEMPTTRIPTSQIPITANPVTTNPFTPQVPVVG